jgi:ectoine hydroxylase-related dioxygenase (phytanoyl-CoA dioxygenase family)
MNIDIEKKLFQFRNEGYLSLVPPQNTPGFDSLIKECFEISERLFIDPNSQLQKKWAHKDGSAKHIVNPHRSVPEFRQLIRSEPVTRVIEIVFGPEPVYVSHSKLSYKVFGKDQEWFQHQDSAYKLGQSRGITIAIFLENCDEKNGTIRVYPGSHRNGRLPHRILFKSNEKEPQIQVATSMDQKPISVNGVSGTICIFDLDTVHDSTANTRGGLRSIFIFEVETFVTWPLEQNGSDALVLNGISKNLRKPAFLPLKKLGLYVFDTFVRPILKKTIFFVYQLKR